MKVAVADLKPNPYRLRIHPVEGKHEGALAGGKPGSIQPTLF